MFRRIAAAKGPIAIVPIAVALLLVVGLTGCDTFSNLTVNCQVGIKNDDNHIAGCEFRNTGKQAASSCVIVHVSREADESEEKGVDFASDKLCSGEVKPGAATEPMPLTFGKTDPLIVAQACVKGEGEDRTFNCQFKIEEIAK